MTKVSEVSKGVFFIVLSAFFFALMAAFVRLSGGIFFIQKTFFRNAVAFLIALFSLLFSARKNGWKSVSVPRGALLFLLLRSIAGSVGIFGNFYAVDHLVLSDAAILNKMSPFATILFSFFLLGEKIRPVPLAAVVCAFLGSLFVIKPGLNFSKMLPTLAGLAGGIGAGFAYACVRRLGKMGCDGKIIVLFFSAFSTILAVPYMVFSFNPMTLRQWIFLVLSGVCAAGGQFSVTAAYFHAPASKISIYDYSQIIFSTLLGFFLFGQIPDIYSFIGYAVIVLMAAVNFVYNARRPSCS